MWFFVNYKIYFLYLKYFALSKTKKTTLFKNINYFIKLKEKVYHLSYFTL